MAIDLSRVANKALEAALEDGQPTRKKRGSTARAMAAGAALAVGARVALSKKPGKLTLLRHLPDLEHLRDIPDRVRDRMADAGWLDDEPDVDDQQPEAEYEDEPAEDEDFDDEGEEPEDDEDFDEDEPPEGEADEDFEDEGEDDEPAPELEIESEDDEELHPEDRPPKPPRSRTKSGR